MSDSEYDIGDASRTAAEIVSEERESHGDAYQNHKQIAELWTAFLADQLNTEIKAWQAAIMMQQVKQSRMQAGYLKFDHFADICGYSDVALESALRDPDVPVDMDEYDAVEVDGVELPECDNCGELLMPVWFQKNGAAKERGEQPADCIECGENPLPPVGGEQ